MIQIQIKTRHFENSKDTMIICCYFEKPKKIEEIDEIVCAIILQINSKSKGEQN